MTNENYLLVRVKEYPLLLIKPVYYIIILLLYILLGLGNKVCNNLFHYAYKHIGILSADKTQAIKNIIIAELEVDKLTFKYNLADTDYQEYKTNSIKVN